MAKGVKVTGLVGLALTFTKPVIWLIDKVGEVDVVSDHLGHLGPFLNSGWGTLATVLAGCALIAWAIYRALYEKPGESGGEGVHVANSGAFAHDNSGTQQVFHGPVTINHERSSPNASQRELYQHKKAEASLPGGIAYLSDTPPRPLQPDISLQDAVAYVLYGHWPATDELIFQHESDLNRMDAITAEMRVKAGEGILTIWGKSHPLRLFEIIPAAFWINNQIDYLSLFGGPASPKTDQVTGRVGGETKFKHLMLSKHQAEALWPR